MNEIAKFGVYKKKLQGLCDEHDLVYSINKDRYPITMTIKPTGEMDGQISMMEDAENSYINPDARLVFAFGEDGVTWKTEETFTISETLFNKLKGYFKNLCNCWLQYFFRDIMEHSGIPKEELPREDAPDEDNPSEDDLDDDPLDGLDDALDSSLEGDDLDDPEDEGDTPDGE